MVYWLHSAHVLPKVMYLDGRLTVFLRDKPWIWPLFLQHFELSRSFEIIHAHYLIRNSNIPRRRPLIRRQISPLLNHLIVADLNIRHHLQLLRIGSLAFIRCASSIGTAAEEGKHVETHVWHVVVLLPVVVGSLDEGLEIYLLIVLDVGQLREVHLQVLSYLVEVDRVLQSFTVLLEPTVLNSKD